MFNFLSVSNSISWKYKTRPECPIVTKDFFFEVLMVIHGGHLDLLTDKSKLGLLVLDLLSQI